MVALPVVAVLASFFGGFGETWLHIAETALPRYVLNTAVLLALVSFGVVSMGVVSAWLVTAYRFPGRDLLEWALLLPLAMPAYVMAYAYTDWLQFTGAVQTGLREITRWQAREYWFPEVRSLPGAAVILSFALYPYVYLVARTAFHDFRAARSRPVGLPATARSARSSASQCRSPGRRSRRAARSRSWRRLPTSARCRTSASKCSRPIFKAWLDGRQRRRRAASSCLLGFVVVLLALERANRGRAAYHSLAPRRARPHTLRGGRALLALAACAAPAFSASPCRRGSSARSRSKDGAGPRLAALMANSFSIAALTALIAVIAGALMAYAGRLTRSPIVQFGNRVAGLGYAIPGAVIAVGVLVPLGRVDNMLASWVETAFGVKTGLLLTGTIAALVYAYLVRLLAVSLQTTHAGLAKITPSMEDAARSLGATPAAALARVHVPLLAPSLATAALLVFVDVLKELPATLALRPFNFDTLAVEAYNLAKDERLAEAATPSLAIVAAGLLPLIYVSKRYFQATRS